MDTRVRGLVVAALCAAVSLAGAAPRSHASDMNHTVPPDTSGVLADGDSLSAAVDQVEGLLFGISERRAEFHGFLNIEGFAFQNQAEHDKSSFDLHNFFFATKAPVAPGVTLFGEAEYEHGATIRLDRAFVDWAVHPLVTLRAGRFYVPMSYERPRYWAPVRLMTSRPLLVDIPFHEWADTGIELFGHGGWLGYDVCLVNGPFALTEAGIPITDVRDNNDGKVPVFRLNVTPHASLEAGAAYSRGRYDSNDSLRFELVEFDARITRGPLDVWAEYDRRSGDDEPGTPGPAQLFTGDRARKSGWYVLASWLAVEGRPGINYLKPLVRFDRYVVPDAGLETRRLSLGVNWSPQPHVVVKTEYQRTDEARGPALRNDGVMGSLVVDF